MIQLLFARRLTRTILVAAALSAQSFAAASQPAPGQPAPGTPQKLESVLGREVAPVRKGEGGRIIDVLIDGSGRVHAYVVEFGGFLGIGTRKIAVATPAFQFVGRKIFVDVTSEQLRAAREYEPNEPPFIVLPTMQQD